MSAPQVASRGNAGLGCASWGLSVSAHVIVWSATGVLVLVLLGITSWGKDRNVWDGLQESRELRSPAYAEGVFAREVFRTRANTWSNLAYVVVGFYGIAFGFRDLRRNAKPRPLATTQRAVLTVAFGVAACLLGFGSGFFHASLTRLGQWVDVASMYPPMLGLIGLSLARRFPAVRFGGRFMPTWPFLVGIIALTGATLFYFKWSMSSANVLTTLISTVSLATLVDRFSSGGRFNGWWLAASFVALVGGVACRQIDIAQRFSGPNAWTYGHAFWHVLTALSLACVFLFYRSEMPTANELSEDDSVGHPPPTT